MDDCAHFCGLLRKAEFYLIDIVRTRIEDYFSCGQLWEAIKYRTFSACKAFLMSKAMLIMTNINNP